MGRGVMDGTALGIGAALFGAGVACGWLAAMWSVRVSIGRDPGWWLRRIKRLQEEAA